MSDVRALSGAGYMTFGETRLQQTEAQTQEIHGQSAPAGETAAVSGQVQALWPPSQTVDDPLDKSLALLRFKDGPSTVSGGTNTVSSTSVMAAPAKTADTKNKIDRYFD